MEYKTLTQDWMDLRVAEAIRSREEEHFHYDLNRRHFEQLLADPANAAIPDVWPTELEQYKKLNRDETIKAIRDEQTLAAVQALQHKDMLRARLKAESLEMKKVESYHAQLVGTIKDKARLDAALASEKAKREAAEAAERVK